MKLKHAIMLASAAITGNCGATVFPDTTGDVALGLFPHLDITSVDVTTDGTDITFRINLNGSPVDTNWGKYMIALRTGGAGATTGNGWGRPISFAPGMTRWIGAYVDSGNVGQVWSFAGSWSQTGGATVTKDATGVTIVAPATSLAIGPGETFAFDVYSSGGGGSDGAVDALSASAASITNWGGAFTTNTVGGPPNPALSFTMPGTANFTTWIGEFGLAPGDQDPGDDPDGDTLTNLQEYEKDLGLDPNNPDTDSDGLDDNVETATGTFVDANDTGSLPAVYDTDGDGALDGEEVNAPFFFGYQSNPNIRNHDSMAVPGNFSAWDQTGGSNNAMDRVNETITGQYQWILHYNFRTLGGIEYKFAANGSWDQNWGNGGNNITGAIANTGFHTFTFDTITQAHGLSRTVFPDVVAFLAAYGVSSGTDTDGDGVNNEAEFAANTDPTEDDTDGDGALDGTDPNPLLATRNVAFTVNMTVQEANGNFNPATGSVVVKFFTGLLAGTPDLALTEVGDTGIYTGTLANVAGAPGTNSGEYKFFNTTAGAPNSGYETGDNRSFVLGPVNTTQTLDTVFFSNDSTLPGGYGSWAAANAGGQAADQDFDLDGVSNGVEYFMGETGSTFTNQPGVTQTGGVLSVTWTKGAGYSGAYGVNFVVETSSSLASGSWTDAPSSATPSVPGTVHISGNSVTYTFPAGTALFARLKVNTP